MFPEVAVPAEPAKEEGGGRETAWGWGRVLDRVGELSGEATDWRGDGICGTSEVRSTGLRRGGLIVWVGDAGSRSRARVKGEELCTGLSGTREIVEVDSEGVVKLRELLGGGLKDRESISRETSLAAAAFKALSSVCPILEGGGGVGGVKALGGS